MADINTVTVSGRLGSDPDIKFFESGTQLATFSIAVNKWDKKQNQEIPNWLDIKVWGKQAEYIGNYGKKGSQVFISGRLDVESWEKDGQKRSKVVILAENITLPHPPKTNDDYEVSNGLEGLPF